MYVLWQTQRQVPRTKRVLDQGADYGELLEEMMEFTHSFQATEVEVPRLMVADLEVNNNFQSPVMATVAIYSDFHPTSIFWITEESDVVDDLSGD